MITWKLLRFFNLSYEKELKDQVSKVHAFAMQVVRRRKSSGELGDDLLSRFISESSSYSDEFLRDIIVSFVLAGRDTTSATLTWFFYLISIHPEVKTKLLDELRAVRARGAREGELTVEQVKGLNYMHAALSETLRLYPPVPLQTRACAESDVWPDGTKVKKGRTVMYSAYAMGKSERIWGSDWEEFRPERWMDEGEFRAVNAFRFPVFHAGPRMCLGKEMAYVQMKTVVAAVMERFEIEVVDEEKKKREVEFTMILRMKGGLPVRVRRKMMMMMMDDDGNVEI
ncbi:cytochrome P450-like [Dioscorea cayenensis subsp. rotundata]|uniref:Cytochrome P450-like n=1 Tax=Dioscorea cayennensis subsp. rotundata TaxID=55577 RepID=A0AB40BYM6_DIOCR|nr:cytochrome P450-like [Dioscorea cayenensis subsp. rotundata]